VEGTLRSEIKNVHQACGHFQSTKTSKSSSKTQSKGGSAYWAAGTGYGNDSGSSSAEWNINAYIETQSKQSDAVQSALTKIKTTLQTGKKNGRTFESGTIEEIEKFLIPVIEYYLSDVSFLDMQNCDTRYVTLFDIIELLASRTQLQSVLLPRKGQSKPIYSIIKSLKTQTKLVISENKNDDSQLDFVKQINRLWEVLKAVKKQPPPSDTTTGTTISSSSSSSTSTTTSTQIQKETNTNTLYMGSY